MSEAPPQQPAHSPNRAPSPRKTSPLRHAAWISLLVSGAFTILGGVFCGTALAALTQLLAALADAFAGPSSATAHSPIHYYWILGLALALVETAVGITQIVCSVKIQHASRVAARVALAAVIAQALLVGMNLWLCASFMPSPLALFGLLVSAAMEIALAAIAYLLVNVQRELPRPYRF